MDTEIVKTILGAASVLLGMACAVPYLQGILKHTIKPHLFTWIIWAVLMSVAATAQFSENAGPGAWFVLGGAFICVLFASLALKYGTTDITKSDKITLAFALLSVPLWLATSDPFYSVLLVTFIDMAGFWPTLRKSYKNPFEEGATIFIGSGVAGILSLVAIETYGITTTLYPAVITFLNFVLGFLILYRRRTLMISTYKTGA